MAGCKTAVFFVVLSAFFKAAASQFLSPVAVVSDGDSSLFVAQHDARQIAVVEHDSGTVGKLIALPQSPNALLFSSVPGTFFAACGGTDGKVVEVEADSGKVLRIYEAGHTPSALALSDDGKTLAVCNRFDNRLALLELASGKKEEIAVLREPVAAVFAVQDRLVFVANHLPHMAATEYSVAAAVSVVDTEQKKVLKNIALPDGSGGVRGMCLTPDGKYVLVTHILARYQLPTTQLERGWMNANALSVIDVQKQQLRATVLLDDVDLGFANPWAVGCSADGKYLAVTSAGAAEISIIDLPAFISKLENSDASLEELETDLSFMSGIRRRIALPGHGARSVAFCGDAVAVGEYFSDTLDLVSLSDGAVRTVALGPHQPMTEERRGEMLFNNAELCFQQWQSCASCHPDSRADALNWDLLNDGIGNPKNTRSMLLTHATPPVMSKGVRDRAETAVRAGIKYIQFSAAREEDAAAIDAYLSSMKPAVSPWLENGKLSASALRGKAVFEKAGCAVCHPEPLFTDGKLYDVGTGTGQDKGALFDVPTLIELWRTAPYLHDGRAATLEELIEKHNPMDTRGSTSGLTESEKQDLIEYLRSL